MEPEGIQQQCCARCKMRTIHAYSLTCTALHPWVLRLICHACSRTSLTASKVCHGQANLALILAISQNVCTCSNLATYICKRPAPCTHTLVCHTTVYVKSAHGNMQQLCLLERNADISSRCQTCLSLSSQKESIRAQYTILHQRGIRQVGHLQYPCLITILSNFTTRCNKN